jgi:acyl-coenzyme A thioesterase PaaI-like protein
VTSDGGPILGGADYGRFVESVRTLQDLARGANAPDDVVARAADLVAEANRLLAPHLADERQSPSGRRTDLPGRGSILALPLDLRVEDGRVLGTARFRRYHLGRSGAAHGGTVAHLFDSLLGFTAFTLGEGRRQRTAYLRVTYRRITPIDEELTVDAGIDRIEGRKIYVSGRLLSSADVLAEAEALFVTLEPGQP